MLNQYALAGRKISHFGGLGRQRSCNSIQYNTAARGGGPCKRKKVNYLRHAFQEFDGRAKKQENIAGSVLAFQSQRRLAREVEL